MLSIMMTLNGGTQNGWIRKIPGRCRGFLFVFRLKNLLVEVHPIGVVKIRRPSPCHPALRGFRKHVGGKSSVYRILAQNPPALAGGASVGEKQNKANAARCHMLWWFISKADVFAREDCNDRNIEYSPN